MSFSLAELINKMDWSGKTKLILSGEKDCLKIRKFNDDNEYFLAELGELIYEQCEEI